MGDAVLRVHSRLQLLARENWSALEESHVRNVTWLREELAQLSRSLDVQARLEPSRRGPAGPPHGGRDDSWGVAGPEWKKQKAETVTVTEVTVPSATAGAAGGGGTSCQQEATTRLSMRLRARPTSTDAAVGAAAKQTRKRGRSSAMLLQNPGKLKVTELRSELRERGLRTSGLKAALFDRLLNALEKEQKEDRDRLNSVKEMGTHEAQGAVTIVIDDDSDGEEIVRESVGSNKSQRSVVGSQSTSPKAGAEKAKTMGESSAVADDRRTTSPLPTSGLYDDFESNAGSAEQTEDVTMSSEADLSTDIAEGQQRSVEVHSVSPPTVISDSAVPRSPTSGNSRELAVADDAEKILVNDASKITRQSMQVGGKSELTSPLVWKRKSILRKASSLAPCAQGPARNVSFAPVHKVDVFVDDLQTDLAQPDPSPENDHSLTEPHVSHQESKRAGIDSCPDTMMTPKPDRPHVAPSSPMTSPRDPIVQALSEEETERQRKKREFDETVQREAQKFRLAAKLSAQKRLEEARASQVLWAKGDQLKSRLQASAAGEQRRSTRTPLADKAAFDPISPLISEPSTVTGSLSLAPDVETLTASASKDEAQSLDTVRLGNKDAKMVESARSLARQHEENSIPIVSSGLESLVHEPEGPEASCNVAQDKNEGKQSLGHRLEVSAIAAETLLADKRVQQEMAEARFPRLDDESKELDRPPFLASTTSRKDAIKSESPKVQTVAPLLDRRPESLSSMVSPIPKPSVRETDLKPAVLTVTNDIRRPVPNLVSGLHSFTALLEKNQPQEKTGGRSVPMLNALKLAEKSRVLEEKKRLEKEKRKAMLKKKMEEHKKVAALKEKAEKEAQAKREQDRLNVRKKREAELAKQRQQKLKEMRAGLEKKRAMLAAERKAIHVPSTSSVSRPATSTVGTSHQRHGGFASASETSQPKPVPVPLPKLDSHSIVPKPPQASRPAAKPAQKPVVKLTLTSPDPVKYAPKSHSPDVMNYEMSDNMESSDGESSDSDADHHGKKKVPRWAQKSHLNKVLHAQFGKNATDPSPAIFQDFVDTCNLEAIFETADISKKKKFARRTSSGNWLADRPTARDRALYQRDMGYDR